MLVLCFIVPSSLLGQGVTVSNDIMGKTLDSLEVEMLLNAPHSALDGLEELRGNVIIIEFWGTWCAPCIKNIPHLNRLTEVFVNRNVRFIAVTEESKEIVDRFLKRVTIAGWIGLDFDRSLIDRVGVQMYPTTLLLDREGVVREILKPEELTEQLIENYLNS